MLAAWSVSSVHRVRMESLSVVVRENAGELVNSARLSRDAKCGEAAAGGGRGCSAGPPEAWPDSSVHRVRMESLCVVVRENAGESVDSARLSRDAKCGEAAAGVGRCCSAAPPEAWPGCSKPT